MNVQCTSDIIFCCYLVRVGAQGLDAFGRVTTDAFGHGCLCVCNQKNTVVYSLTNQKARTNSSREFVVFESRL